MAPVHVWGDARSQDRPEVDHAEDDDPHRVHEVPVEADRFPCDRVDGARTPLRRGEERRERDEAREDVKAVQTREREERGAEERASRPDALIQQARVLSALSCEEDRAEHHRRGEPEAAPRADREGHRAAAREEGYGEDRGAADIEGRSRRREPGVAIRDVREDDREKEDRLRPDEDRNAYQGAIEGRRSPYGDHRESRIAGCLRSQSGRLPVTAGIVAKFSGGGGEVVDHSSVNASHGSSPAISPERRLRARFTKKTIIATARIAAPTVEMRLSGPQPVLAAYVNT